MNSSYMLKSTPTLLGTPFACKLERGKKGESYAGQGCSILEVIVSQGVTNALKGPLKGQPSLNPGGDTMTGIPDFEFPSV